MSYVFCLPTWGAPFISAVVSGKDDNLKVLQKVVGGAIERVANNSFVIHPLFCEEEKRWKILSEIVKSKTVKVYVNEDGYNQGLCANMATITRGIGGCPHFLGDVCVVVPQKVLAVLKINPDAFTLIMPVREIEEGEYPVWEFEDDKEEKEQKKKWASKYPQYDYKECGGYCYKSKV